MSGALAPLLFAVSLALGASGLFALVLLGGASSTAATKRFHALVRGETAADKPPASHLVERWLGWLARFELGSAGELASDPELARLLARAGWPGKRSRLLFTGLRVLSALLGLMAAVTLSAGPLHARAIYTKLAAIFAGFALGYLLPKLPLMLSARARAKRLAEDTRAFARVLCVLFAAGVSLEQAISILVRDARGVLPDLTFELTLVQRQLSAGKERGEAMREMARELAIPDLEELVTLLRQIDVYGGAVHATLAQFAERAEERHRLELQEAASRLAAKMTMVMVLFLFPALLVFVGGPGFLALIRALEDVNG